MSGFYELLGAAAIAAFILGLNVCQLYAGRIEIQHAFLLRNPHGSSNARKRI